MFEKEQMVHNFLQNITNKLVLSGFFIITIPDSCVIVKRMRKFAKKSENPNDDYYKMGN